ncbi:MAG: IS5 family transposase [Xanthobacteraceae bacterium]|jgi:transposase, IS5 family|nr:IS5 family transposase [Pseudolabrys sp.]
MTKQLGFAEAFSDSRLGTNKKLEEIDRLIDWSALEPLAKRVRSGEIGRPPYEALRMLKALYLQRLYDLSDPQLEEALLDRFSFRLFCGFTLKDCTPDETTILRFRQDAAKAGVLEQCFALVTGQLEAQGLMLRQGTMMDASVIRAQRRPPPITAGRGAINPQEPDAGWTARGGKPMLGYKAHVGMDQGSGLLRRVVVTSARVYESEVADKLICGDERAVYGDRAYPLKARRERLKRLGIKDRIMHRADKHHPKITGWRARWNALVALRRAPVEAVFSAMKRLYGLARARSPCLRYVAADVFVFATVYNLRRAAILKSS